MTARILINGAAPATAAGPGWLIGDDAGDIMPAALAASDPSVETDANDDLMPKV